MNRSRGNTTACPIANRHIFIFNGLSTSVQPNQNSVLEYMDLGNCDQASFKVAKWEQIVVTNPEFVMNDPRGSAQLSQTEIILFGGKNNFTYLFDFQSIIAKQGGPAKI